MRRRLLAVILAGVAVALLVSGVATAALLRSDARRSAARELSTRARLIAESSPRRTAPGLRGNVAVLELRSAALFEVEPESASLAQAREVNAAGEPVDAAVMSHLAGDALARLARGETVQGLHDELVYAAAAVPDRPEAVVVLTRPVDWNGARTIGSFAVGAGIAMVVASAAAVVVARRLTRPLRAAELTTRQIAAGDLSVRVPITGADDEVGDLARSINTMAEELDRSRRLERQFLLSVSHDLRTPLTSIRGFAEAIAEGTAPDAERAGGVISSEARRLERLVGDLLELAKLDARHFQLNLRPVDVTEIVTDTADGFLPAAHREELKIDLAAEDNVVGLADTDRLAQVLANLIENAMKFATSSVRVSVRRVDGSAEIAVADDGPGIAPEDLPRIFERLYTSVRRPSRRIGSGLGLAIVHELVLAMGATIVPLTSPDGTTFTVRLQPATPEPRS